MLLEFKEYLGTPSESCAHQVVLLSQPVFHSGVGVYDSYLSCTPQTLLLGPPKSVLLLLCGLHFVLLFPRAVP